MIVIMRPIGAKTKLLITGGGDVLGVLEHNGKYQGLQIIVPQLEVYAEHLNMFHAARIPMAQPAYIGPLKDMPQALCSGDFAPLIILTERMHEPYFDLVGYFQSKHPDYAKEVGDSTTIC